MKRHAETQIGGPSDILLKGKKVVVTGSSGFVGSHLVRRLLREEAQVRGLDITNGEDITNWDKIKDLGDFDIIYHLAALMYVPYSYKEPRNTYFVNTIGTLNMLELCRKNDATMIFSSSYVYGQPKYLPIDEEHPTNAVNPYNQSKIIGEELCQGYSRDHGIKVIIFRPFNIYGIGQKEEFLIPTIIKQAKKSIIQLLDPKPKRDYIYIDDVIEAYLKASLINISGLKIINLGSGISYSVNEVAKFITSNFLNHIDITYTQTKRQNEIENCIANISKAKEMLDWSPKVNLSEGLKILVRTN